MPKISEKFWTEGDRWFLGRQVDVTPTLEAAATMRSNGLGRLGESAPIGRVPMELVAQWLREAGVRWDDTEARNELIRRKLLDGDFSKFRIWEGRP